MGFDDVVEHITDVVLLRKGRGPRRSYSQARCSCGWVGRVRNGIEVASLDGLGHEAKSYIDSYKITREVTPT